MRRFALLLLLLLLRLLAVASICSAQIETGGLTIPGDEAIQVVKKSGFVPLEVEFADGLIFSAYPTSYDINTSGVATLTDRSPQGNHLSQSVEVSKPTLDTQGGVPTLKFDEQFVEGRLVGVASSVWTVAISMHNNASDMVSRAYVPYIYGNKAIVNNTVSWLEYGSFAASNYDKIDVEHSSAIGWRINATGVVDPGYNLRTITYTHDNGFFYAEVDGVVATVTFQTPPAPSLTADFFSLGAIPASWFGTFYGSQCEISSIHVWNRALTRAERIRVYRKLEEIKVQLAAGRVL